MIDEPMVPSRNHRSDIRESMYDAHPANVEWLEKHGYEFGSDATGMAYQVVSPRGIRIAGPDGTAETCSYNGRLNAEATLAAEKQVTGLTAKYSVARTDGRDAPGGDKERAKYFVLDYEHDPLAQVVVGYYADLARSEGRIELANDLDQSVSDVLAAHGDGPRTIMRSDVVEMRHDAKMRVQIRRFRRALTAVERLPSVVEPNGARDLAPNSVEMGRLIGMQDAALIALRALNRFDD